MKRPRPGTALLLVAILLLSFALRVYRLGDQELRGDEAFGYFFVQQGYGQIVSSTLELAEPHPVASYFLLKSWQGMAGATEFALRFPGVWFGVLSVALLLRLAVRLDLHRRVALLAALFLAVNPYAIWHSQDARMYAMSLALNTATVWLALEALARRRWQWIAAYLAVALLALHTHYFTFFTLAALTLFLIVRAPWVPGARAALRDWLIWNVLLALLYAPWLANTSDILSGYDGNGDSPRFTAMTTRALSVFTAGEAMWPDWRSMAAVLAALLLLLGAGRLWLAGLRTRRALGLLLCLLVVPILLSWYGSWERPIFNERYLVTALPAFTLLTAAALQPIAPPRRWLDVACGALLAVALGLAGVGLRNYYHGDEWSKTRGWRELAATLATTTHGLADERVRLAQNYPDPTLWYYTDALGLSAPHLVLPPAANDLGRAQLAVQDLAAQGVQRIVLAVQPSSAWDDSGIAQEALNEQFDLAATTALGNWQVEIYSRLTPASTAPVAGFGSALQLDGVAIEPTSLLADSVLMATLGWSSGDVALPNRLAATVQLLGPDGRVVVQQDKPVVHPTPGESRRQAYAILLPETLAPGDYRLIVAVYDPESDGLPRLRTADGSDSVELGRWRLP